ncbi:MAG TPA: MerR family transcriptional regulator [Ignavibacteriaceae bacterium]|nr:MerR family transcriptional regulator [Ignavibacteriaceae bacterium]
MTDLKIQEETPIFTISTAEKLLNFSVHTIRLYERIDLFVPFLKLTHQRLYSKSDISGVEWYLKIIFQDREMKL